MFFYFRLFEGTLEKVLIASSYVLKKKKKIGILEIKIYEENLMLNAIHFDIVSNSNFFSLSIDKCIYKQRIQ